MPNIVGWKNDFDLDGEIWIAPREEREQLRAARIQGGGQEGEGEGRSRDGDVEMTGWCEERERRTGKIGNCM
jgi:hypothetical protein